MKFQKMLAALSVLIIVPVTASAHHSFAIYDLTKKVTVTGTLKSFDFKNPHIELVLEVEGKDGKPVELSFESMNPRRWDSFGFGRDIASEGEEVTLIGWPAKSGSTQLVLSSIITERGETVIVDRIRQRSAYQ